MSTGITLNNLCYGVLFESFKSNVVNMQSIGRGLGLKELSDNTEKDSQECLNIIKSEIIESYEKICQVCANDIKPRIQYVKSLMINESYIDETIERFDTFMEEFNLTHNEDIHNE